MKKILYITTVSRTINAFLIPHIQMLKKEGHIVDCACFIDKPVNEELLKSGVKIHEVPFSRNPLNPLNIKALKKLIKIQQENQYDIVHVHTPVASVYGRLLKIKFKDIKTIYTVHGFHFYKGSPLINWAMYYPIERLMSKFTDVIITINEEDYERAMRFGIKRVYKANGVGVDLNYYNEKSCDKNKKREELGLKEDDFVICMIAEINKNKNHMQMIKAVRLLLQKGINIKVICAGDGPLIEDIKKYININELDENIKILGFRSDINELINCCDIGILLSYREGLPRNIMELMAFGKPVIGTNIRGIRDLINNGHNGFLVKLDDIEGTANAIETLVDDKLILEKMNKNAYEHVKVYSVENVINQLAEIY